MKKVKTIVIEGIELSYKEVNLSKKKSLVFIYLDSNLINNRKKSKNRKNFYNYKLYNNKFSNKISENKTLNVVCGEYNINNENIITFYEDPYTLIKEYLSKQKCHNKSIGFNCVCGNAVGFFDIFGDLLDFED